jgi:hypothetical protein
MEMKEQVERERMAAVRQMQREEFNWKQMREQELLDERNERINTRAQEVARGRFDGALDQQRAGLQSVLDNENSTDEQTESARQGLISMAEAKEGGYKGISGDDVTTDDRYRAAVDEGYISVEKAKEYEDRRADRQAADRRQAQIDERAERNRRETLELNRDKLESAEKRAAEKAEQGKSAAEARGRKAESEAERKEWGDVIKGSKFYKENEDGKSIPDHNADLVASSLYSKARERGMDPQETQPIVVSAVETARSELPELLRRNPELRPKANQIMAERAERLVAKRVGGAVRKVEIKGEDGITRTAIAWDDDEAQRVAGRLINRYGSYKPQARTQVSAVPDSSAEPTSRRYSPG